MSLFFIVLVSCTSHEKLSYQELIKWVNDSKNGLCSSHERKEISFRAVYMPSPLLASKEMRSQNAKGKKIYDSLVTQYDTEYTFVVTLAPVSDKPNSDIMYKDIDNKEEYKKRFLEMNFDLKNMFSLKIGDQIVQPEVYSFENTYGLSKGRSIYLVFNKKQFGPSSEKPSELDLIFNDEVFNTGINHFVFPLDKINNIPELDLNS